VVVYFLGNLALQQMASEGLSVKELSPEKEDRSFSASV
jgi:hypothetical protein